MKIRVQVCGVEPKPPPFSCKAGFGETIYPVGIPFKPQDLDRYAPTTYQPTYQPTYMQVTPYRVSLPPDMFKDQLFDAMSGKGRTMPLLKPLTNGGEEKEQAYCNRRIWITLANKKAFYVDSTRQKGKLTEDIT